MAQVIQTGVARRISTSGLTCVTSAPCSVLGVWSAGELTGPLIVAWNSRTASDATLIVIGTSTLAVNSWNPMPMDCPGGLTWQTTNETVDLTIFWIPTSLR